MILNKCRLCNSKKLFKFLDLGFHPPSDQFKKKIELNNATLYYPLQVFSCSSCGFKQLNYVVEPKILYQQNYPYESSLTYQVKKHFDEFALSIIQDYILNKSDLDGASQLFQSVQDFIGTVEKNPLILKLSAKTGNGVPEFITKLKKLMTKKKKEKKLSEKQKLAKELDDIVLSNINKKVAAMLLSSKSYSDYLKKVQAKKIDPFEAADNISKSILK